MEYSNGLTGTPARQQICILTEASGGHKADMATRGVRREVPRGLPGHSTAPATQLRGGCSANPRELEWKGWGNNYRGGWEGGGEAGERLNETANALVIPACSERRRQTAMLPAPARKLPGGTGWARTGGNNRTLCTTVFPHVTFKGQS